MTRADPAVLVSACLLGRRCRYDGRDSTDPHLARRIGSREVIPVCPEELGGLGTPREAAVIEGGCGAEVLDGEARVVTLTGRDVTRAFLEGAALAAEEGQAAGAREAFLKSRSPSCGLGEIACDGTTRPGNGVLAELLLRRGIEVVRCDGRPSVKAASDPD